MESLEALKKLFFDNKDLRVDITLNDRKVCEIYNAIKFDLERLEQLEKEYYSLNKEFEDIEFENYRLRKENEKLKQVIDILKKHIEICWQDDGLYTGVELYLLGLKKKNEWIEIDGIDYWKLKEVLGDE